MPKVLTLLQPTGHPAGMAGIAFRSILAPHIEYVRQRRRARATWREIADELTARGVKTSPSNLCEVFRRTMARKTWPAGMEPTAQASGTADAPSAQDEPEGGEIFRAVRSKAKKAQASTAATPPRPYRSRLEPHLAFIAEQRRAGMGWRQIADALGKLGVVVSFQAVQDYYTRTIAKAADTGRRMPFEPGGIDESTAAPRSAPAPAARPPQAEPDEFGGDELDTFRLPKSDRRR